MLVGVCCECQQGGKPLRYERGRALIDSHDAFGYFCQGSGQVPQATYQDSSGSDQMPEGVQVVIGNDPIFEDHIPDSHSWISAIPQGMDDPNVMDRMRDEQRAFEDAHNAKHGYSLLDCPDDFDREEHNRIQDRIQEDQFEREEHEREQAKEAEKFVCCNDPWCNHRPDPPKPPGIFGTIGDILLAAKNGNNGKRKKGT